RRRRDDRRSCRRGSKDRRNTSGRSAAASRARAPISETTGPARRRDPKSPPGRRSPRAATRGPSRSRLSPRSLALPQLIALDLPGHRLRKLRDELDPARVLIRSDAPLHERLEFLGELVRRLLAVLQQNESLGFDELVLVLRADDSALEHRGMLHERGLDLGRRDPLPRYLEHVVAAPLIGEVTVLIEVVLVADDVEYFEPETVLPLIEERFRKRLSGADAHTQRGQVEPEILLGIREERGVEGRRGEEDRRLLLRDERVDELGRGALRLVDARG